MVFSGGRTTWFWKTNQFPLKYQRWWPGWNTTVRLGTTVLRPSFSSGSCVILKKSFPLYIGRNPRKIVVRTFPELDVEYDKSGFFFFLCRRLCGLSRLSVGESGLLHSTREDFYEVKSRQSLCGDQFICNNKKCISKSLECNEKNDCGDNSDESKCSSPFSHQIRLVGGKGPHEGNVQVLLKGRWGFICDDGFAWNEADLICKELGFSKSVKFTRNNHFGKNSKSWLRSSPLYWFSGLNCSSPAANILECTSNGIGHHECSPIEVRVKES
ncbi:Antigen WC1.1 [Armadillidium vulgare]|nr:Antigen WC1.1 [Armadillidium vulgare]